MFKFLKDQISEDNEIANTKAEFTVSLRQSEEIPVTEFHENLAESVPFCTFSPPSSSAVGIKYLNLNTLINHNDAKVEAKAFELAKSSSDLVPGTYEGKIGSKQFDSKQSWFPLTSLTCLIWPCSGGFKIWECTLDLITYLSNIYDFTGKRVLDVGCGSGLLGICALTTGAGTVHFQDYVSF